MRFFWLSFILHIFILFSLSLFEHDSRIKSKFVAYGRHSRKITHAYFKRMKAPKFNYNKYFPKPKKKAKKKKLVVKKVSKKIVKKAAPKKIVKKKEPSKKAPKKKRLAKKELPKKKVQPKKIDKPKVEEEEILHFNVMGEDDPRVIRYQQAIQIEVDRVWSPPLGVPKGTECIVFFSISRNGDVKSFEIRKKSKIVIYNLSITQVARKFRFDKCLWGKSFEVNFRQ